MPSELPHGHQTGHRWCTPCYVVIREPLDQCPACEGLLHRIGSEEICDQCKLKRTFRQSLGDA